MKKISAIFLAFVLLFLCACSDKDSVSTPSDAESDAATVAVTAEKSNIITKWTTDLLPEKFPSPPKGTHDFSIVHGEAATGDYAYTTDFLRITFICPEHEFYSFTNEMISLGYKGGSKNVSEGTYYTDGFKGYWQDGVNYVRISDSTKTDNGEVIFNIDIAECVDNFPEALEKFFPKFNGYCMSPGTFCGHDGNGDRVTTVFEGSFASPVWHWDFRFSNGFVGVEQVEFEKYFHEIEALGYEGTISTNSVDGFSVMSGDLVKSTVEGEYGVFMLYNVNLKTLDIAYTNDSSVYLSEH